MRPASAEQATSVLRGVGEDDVLLGEGRLPFSLLKELPFHYLPLKLYRPPSSPRRSRAAAMLVPNSGGNSDFAMCGGGGFEGTIVPDSRYEEEGGLLGIGIAMVFPNPSIPHTPPSPGCDSTGSLSRPPSSSLRDSNTVSRVAGRSKERDGMEIVLMVHEAEALVSIRN